jgi:hypothetical protein
MNIVILPAMSARVVAEDLEVVELVDHAQTMCARNQTAAEIQTARMGLLVLEVCVGNHCAQLILTALPESTVVRLAVSRGVWVMQAVPQMNIVILPAMSARVVAEDLEVVEVVDHVWTMCAKNQTAAKTQTVRKTLYVLVAAVSQLGVLPMLSVELGNSVILGLVLQGVLMILHVQGVIPVLIMSASILNVVKNLK